MLPPSPCCVVITRPEAQADVWAAQLQQLGFASRRLPLLELRALEGEPQQRAIKNKILDFDLYQKAIFVSQNAVEFGMAWLEDYWPQLPMGIEYFAVGATTAKKLAAYGIAVTDLAVSDNGGMTSEDLLRAPQLNAVDGEKILIFRGLGGRGHLADMLRERGAWVDYCELYERVLPTAALTQLNQLLDEIQRRTEKLPANDFILALHSGESLQNLFAVIAMLDQGQQVTALGQLKTVLLLVPSERIATIARTEGFQKIIVAENATDSAMSAALVNYCQQQLS